MIYDNCKIHNPTLIFQASIIFLAIYVNFYQDEWLDILPDQLKH